MKPMAILNVTTQSCVQCLASGGRGSKQNECPEELKGFEWFMALETVLSRSSVLDYHFCDFPVQIVPIFQQGETLSDFIKAIVQSKSCFLVF